MQNAPGRIAIFATMEEAAKIVSDVKAGRIAPVYLLMGEEPYYIDKISQYFEEHLLSEEEKGFNQTVVYGRDVSADDIVASAKRYPMMAERQLMIVKEAQDLSRTIDQLANYCANPTPTTVLVICYKYKNADKRGRFYKSVKESGVVLQSDKLRESQMPAWIEKAVKAHGFSAEPKTIHILYEFLGNDLGKINNELSKLALILPKGTTVTPKHIEENIGFSKDFNAFELRKAIGSYNKAKAFKIAKHFAENPKEHPMVLTTIQVFSFFSQLLQYHGLKDKSKAASTLGVAPYFVKDYQLAAKNFPMKKVSAIVAALRQTDVRSKGVGADLKDADLLKEMLTAIFD